MGRMLGRFVLLVRAPHCCETPTHTYLLSRATHMHSHPHLDLYNRHNSHSNVTER